MLQDVAVVTLAGWLPSLSVVTGYLWAAALYS